MKPVITWIKGNPTRVVALATVIIGWLAAAGVPTVIVGGLGTVLAILTGSTVYNAVTPVANVAQATRTAALDAAAQVASRLDEQTAGAAGTITETAAPLIATAADGAADAALRRLGVKKGQR